MKLNACILLSSALVLFPTLTCAQGTLADYQRGESLREKSQGLVVNTPGPANWIGETQHFWYTRTVKGGTEFMLVDAESGTKRQAFDQEKLAVAISVVAGHKYTSLALPFAPPVGGGGGRGGAAAQSQDITPNVTPIHISPWEGNPPAPAARNSHIRIERTYLY